jgi:hypothetical protein
LLGNRGFGQELLRYERPTPSSPFALDSDVGISNFAMDNLRDLWMSDDELRLTFSALMPADGIQRIFTCTRATTTEDFGDPVLQVDLESGFDDGGAFLSDNELEIWFHSMRDGQSDIWHARRLNKEARWFPPTKVEAVSTAGHERYPMLAAGSTRLWFSRRSAGESVLQISEREPAGDFGMSTPAAGSFASASSAAVAIGIVESVVGPPTLWFLGTDSAGNKELLAADSAPNSMAVTPDTVSQSAGGSFHFHLHAGSPWANATYTMLVGDPGAGAYIDGVGTLPITQTAGLTNGLRALYGSAELAGGTGSLDPAGMLNVTWTVPAASSLPAALIDRDLGVCFVAQLNGAHFISQAVTVRITP